MLCEHLQALQAPACHENLVKVGGYILGEFGNLIAGDSRSRYKQHVAMFIIGYIMFFISEFDLIQSGNISIEAFVTVFYHLLLQPSGPVQPPPLQVPPVLRADAGALAVGLHQVH